MNTSKKNPNDVQWNEEIIGREISNKAENIWQNANENNWAKEFSS